MNTAAKGARAELRTKAFLEAAGYSCTRSAASGGAWDIIGVSAGDVVLCQVKTRDWPSRAELAELRAFPAPAGVRKLVHRWRRGCSRPDVREL